MPSTIPLVAIRWNDAHGSAVEDVTPENLDMYHAPYVLVTFGLLLKDNEDGVTVANEVTGDGWRGVTFIPRPLITNMWVVAKRPMRAMKRPTPLGPVPSSPSPTPPG